MRRTGLLKLQLPIAPPRPQTLRCQSAKRILRLDSHSMEKHPVAAHAARRAEPCGGFGKSGVVHEISGDLTTHLLRFRAAAFRFDQLRLRAPRAFGLSPPFPRGFRQLLQLLRLDRFIDFLQQPPPSGLPVHRLRARIRNRHTQPRWNMTQSDRRRDLVHMLTARPARAREHLLNIGVAQFFHSDDFVPTRKIVLCRTHFGRAIVPHGPNIKHGSCKTTPRHPAAKITFPAETATPPIRRRFAPEKSGKQDDAPPQTLHRHFR